MSLFSRVDKSFISDWWWTVDRSLLGAILLLTIIGVALVATASPPVAMRLNIGEFHFLKKHLLFLALSIPALIGLSLLKIAHIRRLSFVLFAAGIFAMVGVLVFGMEIKGAQRWIHLLGFSVQPSEFVKPAFIVLIAWFMAQYKQNKQSAGMLISFSLLGAYLVLLILQPDLGMSVVVTLCFAIVLFLAGLPLRYVFMLGLVGILGIVLAYFSLPHVQSRIDRFLNPDAGDTYQISHSLDAFQSGGVFGVGPGQGVVKLDLPDAHADFIFSVMGEEMGLVFSLLLIFLYAFIILRGFNRVMDGQDLFVVLATAGLLSLFGIQAFIHMGSALSLLPTKGMTLPFISYGGSSLLSMSITMGFVLSLTRRYSKRGIAKTGLSIRPVGGI